MEFCKDCGGVLNLFGNNDSGLCSACIQHSKKPVAAPAAVAPSENGELLLDSSISFENGKIILRSKEGWQLWSSPGDKTTDMASILKSARLIYTIRNKRKNKK